MCFNHLCVPVPGFDPESARTKIGIAQSAMSSLDAAARVLETRLELLEAYSQSSALHLDAAEKIETRLREQLESIKLQFETRLLEQSESIREQLAESTRRGAEHSQPAELCLDAATRKLETHLMEQLEPIRVQMTLVETNLQSLRDELAENPRLVSVNLQAAELRLEAAAGKIEYSQPPVLHPSTAARMLETRLPELGTAARMMETRLLEQFEPISLVSPGIDTDDAASCAEYSRSDALSSVGVVALDVAAVDRPKPVRFMVGGSEWVQFFVANESGPSFVNAAAGLISSDDPRG